MKNGGWEDQRTQKPTWNQSGRFSEGQIKKLSRRRGNTNDAGLVAPKRIKTLVMGVILGKAKTVEHRVAPAGVNAEKQD